MGKLVDGVWTTQWYAPDSKGHFIREDTVFRNWVSSDPGADHPPARGRYHLYVSYACPWAHRTLILRKLKKLEDVISVSVVDWFMGEDGWRFNPEAPGATEDTVNGKSFLREVYTTARSDYTGRVTVPILWDKQKKTVVSNESKEIIQMLDSAFDEFGDDSLHFFPKGREQDVLRLMEEFYNPVNNGVYRCGFATTQEAYEEAFGTLFAALDHWDGVLGKQRYLLGNEITAADWCMFTTLLRFDPVYYGHFKCNRQHIYEFENLGPYLRDLYQVPGVAETCNFEHIKNHYYGSHESINPTRVVPVGPRLDLSAPHGRDRFGP